MQIEQSQKLTEDEQQLVDEWWRQHDELMHGAKVVAEAQARGEYRQKFVFRALEDGQLVGMASGMCSLGLGYIHELLIKDEWRGKGIGDALLMQAETFCENHGARRLALRTDALSDAVAFYSRRGWVAEYENNDWFGGRSYFQMRKDV